MHRLVHAIVAGIVGAGIVHIAVLLLIPSFSQADAWSRLGAVSGPYTMTRIDAKPGEAPMQSSPDPLFYAAACRFDLAEGMIQVSAPGRVPFWSVSIYNRGGQNIYSFNDRAALGGVLDFMVLTPAQMIELRKDLPEELAETILVEAPVDEGIVVIRAFVPDASWQPSVSDFLDGAACAPR